MTGDAWDKHDPTVCPTCGKDSCEEHVPPTPPAPGLSFRSAADVMTDAAPVAIVDGVAYADRVTVLASESGAGKTFVLLDMAGHVDDGAAWHGRDVQQGAVAYLGFEGDALSVRLRALRDTGRRLRHLYILRADDPLSPRVTREGEEKSIGELRVCDAIEKLAATLAATHAPPIRLVIVDTVRASLAGSEDSSEHVAAYLRAARRIAARAPGAGLILAHHAGWQDGDTQRKRERGSSAWRGNCDATLYLEAGAYDAGRDATPLTLRTLKLRDDEQPAPLHLIRRRVELAESVSRDVRRGPVTSCVIASDTRTHEDRDAERAAAVDAAQAALDRQVLQVLLDHPNATNTGLVRQYVGVRMDEVRAAIERLIRVGYAEPGKRGHPFTVTPAGRVYLTAAGVGTVTGPPASGQ